MGMLVIAPSLILIGLVVYLYAQSLFANMLDSSYLNLKVGATGGAGMASNVSIAWIMGVINCLIMFVVPFVVNVLKTKNERILKEARMQREFEQEMARYNYTESAYADPYSGAPMDPYTGSALDPYGQPLAAYPGGYDPYAGQQEQQPYGYPGNPGLY
jgi:hypothetical protein